MKRLLILMVVLLTTIGAAYAKDKNQDLLTGTIIERGVALGGYSNTFSCSSPGRNCTGGWELSSHIYRYVVGDNGVVYSIWDFNRHGLKDGDKLEFWAEKKTLSPLTILHLTNYRTEGGKEIKLGVHVISRDKMEPRESPRDKNQAVKIY
jgi:hypothetical protein